MFMGSMIATLRVKGASMSVIKPERTTDNDPAVAAATAAVEQVEGEIRAFVRRDVSSFRRPRNDAGDAGVDNISSVIERVSGASVAEIDRVIAELSRVREMLRSEAERVQREIAGYANLSQAAMTSMKIIAESVTKWKSQNPQPNAETPAPL
ncbi:hypothetical protein RHPLAN_15860 [Rhodoplanes sp. Z2-YC6860]|nr:hypothetical protein RHPLAN_15860 [Rhodoplanes sp. Z2-YC6860]